MFNTTVAWIIISAGVCSAILYYGLYSLLMGEYDPFHIALLDLETDALRFLSVPR